MSWSHLCFLLALVVCSSAVKNNASSQVNPPIPPSSADLASDVDEIVLRYFSNGTVDDRIISLAASSVVRIRVLDVPKQVQFAVVQSHSQIHQTTLARDRKLERANHVNGTSIGILVETGNVKAGVMGYLFNHQPFNITVLTFALLYDRSAPEPGGCNLEFEMEVAPWLRVAYNQSVVTVEHELASLPPARGSNFGCETESLNYEVFHFYLPERDFTQETFFEAIRRFRTPSGVRQYGREIRSFGFTPTTRSSFSEYPGVGRVFAVTVTYTGVPSSGNHPAVAAYVPAVTYGCDLNLEGDCITLVGTTYGKILCALSLFIGLFITFAGHRYFQLEMFLAGFAAFSTVSYILLLNQVGAGETSLAAGTSVMGLLGGLLWWFVWWYWGIPALSVLPVVLMLGFLMASILFYLPISFEFLINDFNFWSAFSCCWLVLPVIFVTFTRLGNIVSCAVLGSYAVIVPIDHYIGSSLKYIVLNVVRRATVKGFGRAVLDPPYQDNELILTLAWIGLAICGTAFQLLREGKRPPFSPPGDDWRPWSWRRGAAAAAGSSSSVSEQTPLIRDSPAAAAAGGAAVTTTDYGSA